MDESYHELLAQVAWMYFEQELTQNAIASELGLSRVKVYRLLKQAKEEQVVQFSINWPAARDKSLEEALQQQFVQLQVQARLAEEAKDAQAEADEKD